MKKRKSWRAGLTLLPLKIFFVAAVFVLGAGAGWFATQKLKPASPSQQDKYQAFLTEVYDQIQENYWEKTSDTDLTALFVAGTQKLTGQNEDQKIKTKPALEKSISQTLSQFESEDKKKEYATKLADLVLTNLKPFGRSRLYSQKEEKELTNNLQNINPEVNAYQVLGVNKTASPAEIKRAYGEKLKDPEKAAAAKRAYEILKDEETRKIYDQSGVEPTVTSRLIGSEVFYLRLNKFSPTSLEELQKAAEKVDHNPGPNSLILDLKDNIGGAIDGLPYILGPFIGQNNYAYQFFHQGETTDFKTKTGWLASLVRYKKVVILVNNQTQSSAEVMAAVLKKYNVGILMGVPSRGWGTVEKIFPLKNQISENEKYSLFLVHSLTLREDGLPIEGNGVVPVIDIRQETWEKSLSAYFPYPPLIEAVKEVL